LKIEIDLNKDKITHHHENPLYPVIVELKAASDAIKEMQEIGVGEFQLYEIAWHKFLQSIDRSWNKLQSCCLEKKGWKTFESKINNKRNKDQLLNYLKQARNATEHSISPVLKEWDANLTANPTKDGIQLTWSPYDRPLQVITNRGCVFLPPKEHLGKPMNFYSSKYKNETEPMVAAILAMHFYLEWTNKASEKLFASD